MPAPKKTLADRDDVDALVERISEDVDRSLFQEAVRCFGAGAYRAAYVMAWISVAESLRNKFLVMAGRNDSQAGDVVKRVRTLEKQNQATDSYLLDQAGALSLITDEQEKRLGHLRDMRNLYAHPTGSGPTEHEVLATLEVAVDAVLSQPPLLRHAYARQLLSDLFEDRHFLADEDETVRDYARDVARRLHPEVAPYLLAELVGRSEQLLGDPERGRERRRVGSFVAGFVAQLEPDLSKGQWTVVGLAQRHPVATSLLLSQSEVWRFLPDQAKSMILGHLTEPVKDESGRTIPRVVGLQQARILAKNGLLTKKQEEKLVEAVDTAPYRVLQQAGISVSSTPLLLK